MSRPIKAIITGAIVLALGGLTTFAQPLVRPDVAVLGAEMTELPGVPVTATQQCDPYPCTHTASDPRVTGTLEYEFTGSAGSPGAAELGWADVNLEGPDGSWTGHIYIMLGDGGAHATAVLSGTGAYEGWQYVASGIDPEGDGSHDWSGVVYLGELPPYGPLPPAS